MLQDNDSPGYWAFEYMVRNTISHGLHDAIVSQQMRQSHPSFPVSAKLGSSNIKGE